MMVKMIDAGMDVACLNFAQGDHKVSNAPPSNDLLFS
jgi:pyruvate kinase